VLGKPNWKGATRGRGGGYRPRGERSILRNGDGAMGLREVKEYGSSMVTNLGSGVGNHFSPRLQGGGERHFRGVLERGERGKRGKQEGSGRSE